MLDKNGLKLLRNWFWLFITWKNEQKISFWHFGIYPGQEIHIFLVVCEPYRALESVQGVRFQGKNCFTKMASKLLLNWFWLFITWKIKQKILLWHFGICLGQCRTDGREYAISLRPITGAGFWKKNLYQKWWRFPTITMQKTFSEGCALCKKIFWWHFGIFTFSVTRRFPSFLSWVRFWFRHLC